MLIDQSSAILDRSDFLLYLPSIFQVPREMPCNLQIKNFKEMGCFYFALYKMTVKKILGLGKSSNGANPSWKAFIEAWGIYWGWTHVPDHARPGPVLPAHPSGEKLHWRGSFIKCGKLLFPAATPQHDTAGFVRLIRGRTGPILVPVVTSKAEVKPVPPLEHECSAGSHWSLAHLSAVHCTWIPAGLTCTLKNKWAGTEITVLKKKTHVFLKGN